MRMVSRAMSASSRKADRSAARLLADLRRFGFSVVVSSGNEAVTTSASIYLGISLVDDAGYEGHRACSQKASAIRNALVDGSGSCRTCGGKPVVVLKVGRSERTRARHHQPHRRIGWRIMGIFRGAAGAHRAIEVADLDEMTEVHRLSASLSGWPKGSNINILTTSGGQAELILDVATEWRYQPRAAPSRVACCVSKLEVGRYHRRWKSARCLGQWRRQERTCPRALRAAAGRTKGTDIVCLLQQRLRPTIRCSGARVVNWIMPIFFADVASVQLSLPHYYA